MSELERDGSYSINPDYVKVTLICGSVLMYCRDKMEREVLDTSAGGCHVRMQPVCASIGIRHGQVMLGGHDSEETQLKC